MDAEAVNAAIEALDVEAFWRDGYAILPDVYTAEEIAALREAAFATQAGGGDLLVREGLSGVITDGRLIRVAQKLLGVEEIFYCGDSSVTINSNSRGWHKDNTDRADGNAPDWDDRYSQLRFGIYLQDHVTHTGGLNLKRGSHNFPSTKPGEIVYVKSKPGDLVVWSLRITHSGNGMLLKDPNAPFPDPDEQDNFAPEEVAEWDGDRIAVFAHLGARDRHARRYANYLKTRTYMVNAWRTHPYTDEQRQAAKDAGLFLRDMPAEVMDDPTAGLKAEWEPFPYRPNRAKRAQAQAAAQQPAAAPAPGAPSSVRDVARTVKHALKTNGRRGRNALRGARDAWRQG